MVNACRAGRSGKWEGVGTQETGCSWAWSCGAVVAQARAATRQLFAARRQLVDLCSNFSHCATCCAIWSPRAAAAAVVADDVAVAAAAAPSTMMVAPIGFCKCLQLGTNLHSPPLPSHPSACPVGLLPRILSIFHMSLYGRIYRSMRLIATRFCLVAEDKCNSHSNWTCTFMAFSFSFPLCLSTHPAHALISFFVIRTCAAHKATRKCQRKACVCVGFLPFSGAASAKKFPKYPS